MQTLLFSYLLSLLELASQFRPNWSKLSRADLLAGYTEAVETQLSSLPLPNLSSLSSSPNLIDHLLTQVIHSVACVHVPAKQFHHHTKPGWNVELKRALSSSKSYTKLGWLLGALGASGTLVGKGA